MAGMNEITRMSGVSSVDAKNLFTAILETCKIEGKVVIKGFGTFAKKHKEARKARNPKTGEIVDVAPKDVFVFKASKDLLIEEVVYKPSAPTYRRR